MKYLVKICGHQLSTVSRKLIGIPCIIEGKFSEKDKSNVHFQDLARHIGY